MEKFKKYLFLIHLKVTIKTLYVNINNFYEKYFYFPLQRISDKSDIVYIFYKSLSCLV